MARRQTQDEDLRGGPVVGNNQVSGPLPHGLGMLSWRHRMLTIGQAGDLGHGYRWAGFAATTHYGFRRCASMNAGTTVLSISTNSGSMNRYSSGMSRTWTGVSTRASR
jgi:hypothetical protein